MSLKLYYDNSTYFYTHFIRITQKVNDFVIYFLLFYIFLLVNKSDCFNIKDSFPINSNHKK